MRVTYHHIQPFWTWFSIGKTPPHTHSHTHSLTHSLTHSFLLIFWIKMHQIYMTSWKLPLKWFKISQALSILKIHLHTFFECLHQSWKYNCTNIKYWWQKWASLAKWSSVRLRTQWLWVWVPLQSLKLQISGLFQARSSLTFRQL